MSDVVYRAHIRIERHEGPDRTAHLPADTSVAFGVHGAIAEHYGAEVASPRATTLDYIMAATGG